MDERRETRDERVTIHTAARAWLERKSTADQRRHRTYNSFHLQDYFTDEKERGENAKRSAMERDEEEEKVLE